MFGSQLVYDRDIEAQLEAVRYFGELEKTNTTYCTALTRTLMDDRYFYGVRIAAAQALADCSNEANNFIGLEYLLKAFGELYCFDDSFIPKSNDFSDFRALCCKVHSLEFCVASKIMTVKFPKGYRICCLI